MRSELRRGFNLWSAFTPFVLLGLVAVLGALRNPASHAAAPATQPVAAVATDADLALVPADAVAFAHVRLADVWKSDLMGGFRASFEKAGPKALAALDEQLVPPPSAFDRLTVFVTLSDRGVHPVGLLSFSKPIDAQQLVKTYYPKHEKRTVMGKTLYVCDCGGEAYFPSDRQVMVGPAGAVEQYLARPVAAEGNMKAALELAATKPVVLAGNLAALPIPPQAFANVPPEIVPLLQAQTVTLSMDLAGDPRLSVAAGYKDAAAADAAEKALDAAKKLAKAQTARLRADLEEKLFDQKRKTPRPAGEYPEVLAAVMGIGAINSLDEFIDNPGIKKTGTSLGFEVRIPKEVVTAYGVFTPVAVGLLLPAVQKVRSAAGRAQSVNNLKQLAIAIHNYHDAMGKFPSDIKDKNGKPILSWRVAILPYIEQTALYNQFKLDQPWDSEANRRASQTMVKVFQSPNAPQGQGDGYGMTNYVGVSGPGTAFDPKGNLKFTDFTDGLSNTVMLVETANAVPWAKPGDFVFDPTKPLTAANFLLPGQDVFNVAMGDGSVRAVSRSVSEKTLKAAFTRNGGEILGPDW